MNSLQLSRLSFNQMTAGNASLAEVVDACASLNLQWLGAWRQKLDDLPTSAALIRNSGLRVSSLCRGGFFPAPSEHERALRIDDNLRAIDEAAALGADLLVLVCGPAPDRNLDAARGAVMEGISRITDHARSCGVRLGIESLHPMLAGERSVVVTLNQANQMAEQFDPDVVGVVVDVYHIWWDPQVYHEIARAGKRIFAFHVSDWLVPTKSLLLGRGLMGDGIIEISRLRKAVEETGYSGPIEVEILNDEFWLSSTTQIVKKVRKSFLEFV